MVLWGCVYGLCLLQSYLLLSGRYLKFLRKNPIFPCEHREWPFFAPTTTVCHQIAIRFTQSFSTTNCSQQKLLINAKLFMKMMNHKRVNKICICITAQAEKSAHSAYSHMHFLKHRNVRCVELFIYISARMSVVNCFIDSDEWNIFRI